jgi:hypothetical protein
MGSLVYRYPEMKGDAQGFAIERRNDYRIAWCSLSFKFRADEYQISNSDTDHKFAVLTNECHYII